MICPVCSGAEHEFVRKAGQFQLYLCRTCRVRFSEPMQHPGQAWYEESDIYEEVRWNLPRVSDLGKRWEFSLALRNLRPEDGALFDVGCGRGDFLKLAAAQGFDGHGIDLNRTLVRVAEEAYGLKTVEHGTVEEFQKRHPGQTFGAVTAFEVLEHVPDPHDFIRQCARLLKKGGRLAVSVPGYHRWPHWVDSEVDTPPHHLVLWSKEGLEKLLAMEGFEAIRVWRKPFLLSDLMYHVVRWFPWVQAPGMVRKLTRGALKVIFVPVWGVLSLFPHSGGFTLMVVGTKS